MPINTEIINTQFLIRRGNINEWNEVNPIPALGEPCLGYKIKEGTSEEIESYILKIGDGQRSWTELEGFGTADLTEIHKYMEEHGGAWDAISLVSEEENKQFNFKIDTTTINHSTPTPNGSAIAAGMIYNAGQNGSASFGNNDHMVVEGKSTFAAGRNIKINANYASALGSHHINEGYGAFTAGTGNILITLANNNGSTKNSQYATAFGQQVGTIGAASFSAGTGNSAISNFVEDLTVSSSKEEVYNKWIALERGKRPSISWGDWSARFGSYNISIGNNSFVAGGYNVAVGDYSVAFGENTITKESWSFVCGANNNALKYGFACGGNNTMLGERAFVAGYNNIVNTYSAAFGQGNIIKGTHGFATGYSNSIYETGASHSGAIGMNNHIGYGGYYSFVAGLNNVSHNNGAAVLGAGLISSTSYGLTIGRLNKEVSNALFVVGNGTGDVQGCTINRETHKINYNGATPSNAFVVYNDGHAEVTKDDTSNNNSVPRMQTLKTELAKKVDNTTYNNYINANNNTNNTQNERLTTLENQVSGLSNSLHFKGVIIQDPSGIKDGYFDGDVVMWNGSEYVWYDNKFNEFGPATDFVTEAEFDNWKEQNYNQDCSRIDASINTIQGTIDGLNAEQLHALDEKGNPSNIQEQLNAKATNIQLENLKGFTTIKTTEDGWTETWVDDKLIQASKIIEYENIYYTISEQISDNIIINIPENYNDNLPIVMTTSLECRAIENGDNTEMSVEAYTCQQVISQTVKCRIKSGSSLAGNFTFSGKLAIVLSL